jgi:ABC-type transport system involved in cytochrome c biogenesis ATPase subunit
MAWISATTLDDRNANLQTSQIAAILDRVPKKPQEGSVVILATGETLEVKESPAELLRSVDSEEHPENPSAQPGNVW